ncbi:MAG TPA: electron transfer flavoprotein subunit beta/FixA family protein [Anaerolineales bacterium]|nr:electron transfer flavoprotein subunit beta/FixA family protein [Anaerolineales bacterium]
MKIAVFVKQVPDSAAKVALENGVVSWGDAPLVINPWDEYAVEAALSLTEQHGGEVTAISLGDESAKEALKHALAMGCGHAILISDPALKGIDSAGVARVCAAAVQKLADIDVAVFGKQAIDSDTGLTAAMAARILGWPALTLVASIAQLDPAAKTIRVQRGIEEGRQIVEGKLPAVISIVKDFGEPRYPSFMGIRKASKAEIPSLTLAELGTQAPEAKITWPELISPPKRKVTNEMITGASADEIAANLADKIIAEGVL